MHTGFTIVELLVVIVVIGILAAITIVSYNGITNRAVEASLQSDLQTAATTLAQDRIHTNAYPEQAADANGGKGLPASGTNTLSYLVKDNEYCVTASSPKTSKTFYVSSLNQKVQPGSCTDSAGNVWTAVESPLPARLTSVTYGGGMFMAVADGVITPNSPVSVSTSPNGMSWMSPVNVGAASAAMTAVSPLYANGGYSIMADLGYVPSARSVDGVSWQTATPDSNPSQFLGNSIAYGNGVYVAPSAPPPSSQARIFVSTDGLTWSSTAATNGLPWMGWNSAIFADGKFVIVSKDGTAQAATSSNGTTWTRANSTPSGAWSALAYGNGTFVAVAPSGANQVMTSPDGLNWTAQAVPEASAWKSITYGSGRFVAVASSGTHQVMTSPDGITWTARDAAEANPWTSVTYGKGCFVATAYSGSHRIMTSCW